MLQQLPFFISNLKPETIQEYFSGIAVLDNDIIIDSTGLSEYKKINKLTLINSDKLDEGRFFAFIKDRSGYTCKSDAFGQEPIFYYNRDGVWAISNSLLYLAEKLKSHKVSLSLYPAAIRGFLVGNQSLFGGQLLSHNTPFEQIKLLPYGQEIRIKKNIFGSHLKTRLRKQQMFNIQGFDEYEYWLSKYINGWKNRIESLAKADFSDKFIDLSGGYDSRVNFSFIANSEIARHKTKISTIKNNGEDYRVASDIVNKFYFHIGNPIPVSAKGLDADSSFEAWKYGAAGIYAPMYVFGSSFHVSQLKIHGANYRGRSYINHSAEKRLEIMKKSLPEEFKEEVAKEFINSFVELGIDIDTLGAIEEHYTAFRCRLHYGRNWHWRFNRFQITPQLSPLYRALSEWRHEYTNSPEQITCDVLYLQDKKLAHMPFDVREKSFSSRTLENSSKLRLHKNKNNEETRLYGSPEKTALGKESSQQQQEGIGEFKKIVREKHAAATNSSVVRNVLGNEFIKASKKETKSEKLPISGKISIPIATHIISDLVD